jgi:hypothetical protein
MRIAPVVLALLIAIIACERERAISSFESTWTTSPDRTWVGPGFWANRLQDWRVKDGRLECIGGGPMRTVHVLTRRLSSGDGDARGEVELSTTLGTTRPAGLESEAGSAGFLIGAGAGLDYRAAALVHHSYGESAGLYAGIDGRGRLFVSDFEKEDGLIAESDASLSSVDSIGLRLSVKPSADGYMLSLAATHAASDSETIALNVGPIARDRLVGNIALVSNTASDDTTGFWFRRLRVYGNKLDAHDERTGGPIIGGQHTLSRGKLKLTAQLMPIGSSDSLNVDFQVREGASWETVASSRIVVPGYTATFELDGWDVSRDSPYRLAYVLRATDGTTRTYYQEGVIRRNPIDKDEIVVATFTGNHNVAHPGVDRGTFPWSWGVWFPHNDIIRHVSAHEPDFLFFSGDQVYEGASPTRADRAHPYEDYLYKWYLWHWAFGGLTAEIPTVSIPDDHDVYHGNIWGAGGIATPEGLAGAAAQDKGGYKLPPDWVNMVQRTQTSHLPDPYDSAPAEQGIGVYYTDILYGGVSFAVIEDRKFKSAPAPLIPEAEVWNGWPQNPSFDPIAGADVAGATLLGDRQVSFLEGWAADWSDGTWMKVMLSQTIFANVATLPDSAASGAVIPSLEILAPGDYAANEKTVSDMDSNGWPQSGRNRALRAMRRGFAVHLAGDQHLASTIQYGIDRWGDAGYALCVPSIANFWPRRWFPPTAGANRQPGSPRYTGDHVDGFGNKMTVHAVANPHRYGKEPTRLHERAPGYGIARFDHRDRTISLAAWPRWADPSRGDAPYPGWPVVFGQVDNYGRMPIAHLPTLAVTGTSDPVVQVVQESSGEAIYTLRISGGHFTPMVFAEGSYTLHVGEPRTDKMKTFTGVFASTESGDTIRVEF